MNGDELAQAELWLSRTASGFTQDGWATAVQAELILDEYDRRAARIAELENGCVAENTRLWAKQDDLIVENRRFRGELSRVLNENDRLRAELARRPVGSVDAPAPEALDRAAHVAHMEWARGPGPDGARWHRLVRAVLASLASDEKATTESGER